MATDTSTPDYARRHLQFGWWSLLGFLSLGFALELLHGFKIGLYLDVDQETRRLMWTLAHAHGALLGLIHVAYAVSIRVFPGLAERDQRTVSLALIASSVLLPGGFFAGGLQHHGGDPGLGILVVPLGATCLGVAVYLMARATLTAPLPTTASRPQRK